ncbi:MAG: prepilin-type N-terminal cleavage/methylation domain-containing protein [Candidatus Hydrogenedentes bacterium]|nr:prepilin-type N-terminal cleavage/methylation domain-containing protein [Candidatus Hydrogenedentota bacterium]
MARKDGFTLLELMIMISVLLIVMGLLSTLALNVQSAAASQDARIAGQDEVRTGMQWISRELRQATAATVNANTFPATSLIYRRAADIDGNGTAVNAGVFLETTAARTLQRDAADANNDGRTRDQLVMIEGATVRVVTNGLLPDEDTNNNNVLDGGEDNNFNGVLDRGVSFQQLGGGVLVTIQSMHQPSPRDQEQLSTLREVIAPRN